MLCSYTQAQEVKPFVKGTFAEIQQQHQGKPYLIMFWSEDCAYCMKELAMFGQVLEQQTDVSLITVATDPFLEEEKVQKKLATFNLQQAEAWVFAEPFAETLYFDVDKRWRGSLPLTFMFDSQNNKTKKIGLLSEKVLENWLIKTAN